MRPPAPLPATPAHRAPGALGAVRPRLHPGDDRRRPRAGARPLLPPGHLRAWRTSRPRARWCSPSNHSGNAFPYDAIIFDAALWRADGYEPERKLRAVYEKELSYTWWMRPFGLDDFWRRGRRRGHAVRQLRPPPRARATGSCTSPRGCPGIGKGFNSRYQLQRFSTSFVLLAARHRTPGGSGAHDQRRVDQPVRVRLPAARPVHAAHLRGAVPAAARRASWPSSSPGSGTWPSRPARSSSSASRSTWPATWRRRG